MSDITDTITHDIVDALAQDELTLPMLPEVALRIRQAVDDEDIAAAQLAEAIQQDPGLSARLIRVANSPLMRANRPIEDLQQAINRLGLAFTANLATGFAMQHMFQSTSTMVDDCLRRTWGHAMDVAAVATVLCRHFTQLRPDLAMLAGLTHAIGVLPILAWVEEHPARVPDSLTLDLVVDSLHGEIGGMILKEWAFPDELCVVPTQYLWHERKSQHTDYVDVVMVANLHTWAGSEHPLAKVDWSRVPAFQRLGLEADIEAAEATEAGLPDDYTDEVNATREAIA